MLGEKRRFTDIYSVRRAINWMRTRKLKKRYYRKEKQESAAAKTACLIYCADGHIAHGGLADRIYGIMSLYALCKIQSVPFSIFYDTPYDLSLFLVPNEYDWRIEKEAVVYNRRVAVPRCLLGGAMRLPKNAVSVPSGRQVHAYCNFKNLDYINKKYGTQFSYTGLFHELFKLSPAFAVEFNECRKRLPEKYAGLQVRVLNAFGDFPDTVENPLSEAERTALVEKCAAKIAQIHAKTGIPVLFTSDSQTLVSAMKEHLVCKDFLFTIPGAITHTDSVTGGGINYEIHKKTFIDLFMLSESESLYQIRHERIYKSGFSMLAAQISGKKVQFI